MISLSINVRIYLGCEGFAVWAWAGRMEMFLWCNALAWRIGACLYSLPLCNGFRFIWNCCVPWIKNSWCWGEEERRQNDAKTGTAGAERPAQCWCGLLGASHGDPAKDMALSHCRRCYRPRRCLLSMAWLYQWRTVLEGYSRKVPMSVCYWSWLNYNHREFGGKKQPYFTYQQEVKVNHLLCSKYSQSSRHELFHWYLIKKNL